MELSHIANTGGTTTSNPLWTPGFMHTTLENAFLRAQNRTAQRPAANDTQLQQTQHDQPQPQAPSGKASSGPQPQGPTGPQAAAPFVSSALDGVPLDFADDLLWKVVQAWKDAKGHGGEGLEGPSDATTGEPEAGDTHGGEPLGDGGGGGIDGSGGGNNSGGGDGGSGGGDGGSAGSGGRRRLAQFVRGGNQGQQYANAFRLIFGNFFDLVGGGGW